MKERFDVAIIGAGFSGSILAWILAKAGRSVALIDSGAHPRFAIGESSTPIADRLLQWLSNRHDIPELNDLSTYGHWQQSYPEISCGRKRGFSYYLHRRGLAFEDSSDHDSSLLVAASASDSLADTHWYRPEVDQFFFQRAIASGAHDLSRHAVDVDLSTPESLRLIGQDKRTRTVTADTIVDASGRSSILAKIHRVADRTTQLRTESYSTFGHFRGLGSWHEHLVQNGFAVDDDPFHTDAAAQHHLIETGWVWMLRFGNGITSVGVTGDHRQPLDLGDYPSLHALFETASIVDPSPGRTVSTDRIQRLYDPVLSERSLLLPTAAVTIDPLHSTGIAHGLSGVARIADILLAETTVREKLVANYRDAVLGEAMLLDRLVATAYRTRKDFRRFVAACMVFFAGAIRCEERLSDGEFPDRFWSGDDDGYVATAQACCDLLESATPTDSVVNQIRQAISPWNTAGLMEPGVQNRYAYTATK